MNTFWPVRSKHFKNIAKLREMTKKEVIWPKVCGHLTIIFVCACCTSHLRFNLPLRLLRLYGFLLDCGAWLWGFAIVPRFCKVHFV